MVRALRSQRRQDGFVLLEVIAVIIVLGLAGVALLSAASTGLRAARTQSTRILEIVQERNAHARATMEDVTSTHSTPK